MRSGGLFYMLSYNTTSRNPNDLKLGGHFNHVDYCWKPYEKRSLEHQEDWGRLFNHIQKHGIENPLIVFEDCVLIGQRRCEIAVIQKIPSVSCLEITTDITNDTNADRVLELRNLYQKVSY